MPHDADDAVGVRSWAVTRLGVTSPRKFAKGEHHHGGAGSVPWAGPRTPPMVTAYPEEVSRLLWRDFTFPALPLFAW
jgi:hypothetical protein